MEQGTGQVKLLGVLGLCLCVVLGAGTGCGSKVLRPGLVPAEGGRVARLRRSGGRYLGRLQRTGAEIVVTCQGL